MSQRQKLLDKLRENPKSFTFDEAEALLNACSFHRSNKGKTSGSRVMFTSYDHDAKLLLHKPHPRKELLIYQVRQIKEFLTAEGLL